MELPIELKFFKQIELYQYYRTQERRKSEKFDAWQIEKKILGWTYKHHYHIGIEITKDGINKDILDNPRSAELDRALENLVREGYAKGDPKLGVIIEPNGFLMGELISEIQEGSEWKYFIFYWIVWLTIWAGVLIVIVNAGKIIWSFIKQFIC
jgi:hypothetical protein